MPLNSRHAENEENFAAQGAQDATSMQNASGAQDITSAKDASGVQAAPATQSASTAQDPHHSHRMAAWAVFWVLVFSCLFLSLIYALDSLPQGLSDSGQDLSPAEETASEPFYVLLIGSDSRKGTTLYTGNASEHAQTDQHSDVMTLMRVDPTAYTITLVTVPRDTLPVGSQSKINDALLKNKPADVVTAVEKLTGVEIAYYMMTTFTKFEAFINGIGGVVVDVPETVSVTDPQTADTVTLKAGENKRLNGSQALTLARARKEYDDNQDALRQCNVRSLEVAIMQAALNSDADQVLTMLFSLENNTSTNMDMSQVSSLALSFVSHREEVVFYSCTGPYEGSENKNGDWVVPEDTETWAELMAVVDAGGDPGDIVPVPEF